jgi:hypothetical protein
MNTEQFGAEAARYRAGLPHKLTDNEAALVSNVGEFTAGMIRIAAPSERDYIEQSLNGITNADNPETTKLVLALVAQEIRWRLDKLDLLPR